MRALRIALLLLTIAPPVFSQPQADLIPKLVPWTPATEDEPGKFFVGAIYPDTSASEPIRFLLDATMTTPEGMNYFGIGLKVRTSRLAAFSIVWRQLNGRDVTVVHVGSSCFSSTITGPDIAHAAMLGLGGREGMRLTGRETVGAAPGQVTNLMNQNTPVFMYECARNDGSGPPFERKIHILLPEPRIQFSGSLMITALYYEQPPPPQRTVFDFPRPIDLTCLVGDCNTPPTLSPPLVLPLVRERPKVLVLGDSVAWGQGLQQGKAGRLVVEDMRRRYRRVRMTNKAHSGARIRVGDADRIRDVDIDDCLTDRSLQGEIPRRSPSVQCQILDAVSSECFVDESDIGVRPIPAMRCFETLDERRPRSGESRFNFDFGPAYDVVILWGCINDVSAPSIFTGLLEDFTSETLIERTTERCNLRNGLSDIREFLPNAKIVVNQYHLIVSTLTAFSRSNCGMQQAIRALEDLGPFGSLPFFASTTLIDAAAVRSATFRNTSTQALRASADALNSNIIGQDRKGRGAIQFLEHAFFNPPGGAFWASNDPLVFPLRCNSDGTLAAIDPVRWARASACATEFGVSALDPFRVAEDGFMTCVRASGFHPNRRANRLMADRIIAARVSLYPRMMNFSSRAPAIVNPNGSRR